jgi:hypothetical protein
MRAVREERTGAQPPPAPAFVERKAKPEEYVEKVERLIEEGRAEAL